MIQHERESIIRRWMRSTVGADGIEKYDDLHIDLIDATWNQKNLWIEGGLDAFQLAVEVRNDECPKLILS
ncbi:MAG TPA: hypothetical protein VFO86_05340 [Terriglobia bacterium]|nr:hypothetical protein [Terriglobia bacterium]